VSIRDAEPEAVGDDLELLFSDHALDDLLGTTGQGLKAIKYVPHSLPDGGLVLRGTG